MGNSPLVRSIIGNANIPTLTASLRDLEFLATLPADEIEHQLVDIANDPERSTWLLALALKDVGDHGHSEILQDAWDAYPWPDELDED